MLHVNSALQLRTYQSLLCGSCDVFQERPYDFCHVLLDLHTHHCQFQSRLSLQPALLSRNCPLPLR